MLVRGRLWRGLIRILGFRIVRRVFDDDVVTDKYLPSTSDLVNIPSHFLIFVVVVAASSYESNDEQQA